MITRKKHKGFLYQCRECGAEYKTWPAYWRHSQTPKICEITNNLKDLKDSGWVRVDREYLRYAEKNDVEGRWEIVRINKTATPANRYDKAMFVRKEIGWLLSTFKGDCLHYLLTIVRDDETFLPAVITTRDVNGENEAIQMCFERYDALLIPNSHLHKSLNKLIAAHKRFENHYKDRGGMDPDKYHGHASLTEYGTTSLYDNEILLAIDAMREMFHTHQEKYLRGLGHLKG